MRVRFNTIFYFVLAAGLLLYLKLFNGASQYLDSNSIVYYAIFACCIFITIVINGKRKNIFLEMLIILILSCYYLRIPILLCSDAPTTLTRISVSPGLVNHKILELCYHYLALSFAIIIINPKINKFSFNPDRQKAKKILLFSSALILFGIVSDIPQVALNLGHFIIISRVCEPTILTLILITFIIASGRFISKGYKYWAITLIIIYSAYLCYMGSKQSIVLVLLQIIIARLVCYGPIVINIRDLITTIILFPLILGNFLAGSIMRLYQRGVIEGGGVIDSFRIMGNSFINMFYSVSSRMGYFDYYVESSLNSHYLPYISFKYYFKSIVDKLTPGFDVFNVPFASRMFQYARTGVMNETMVSDQVTLFGEASVIFSFFSPVMFFIMIMFFNFLIKKRPSNNFFMNIFYLAIVFRIYFGWINGFGFDMFFITDLVCNILFFLCILIFWRLTFRWNASDNVNSQDNVPIKK